MGKKVVVILAVLALLSVSFSCTTGFAEDSKNGKATAELTKEQLKAKYKKLYDEYAKTLQNYYVEKQRRIQAEGVCFSDEVKRSNIKLQQFQLAGEKGRKK